MEEGTSESCVLIFCFIVLQLAFGYTRTDGKQTLLAIFNFSDKEAAIAPELDGKATMLLNTDWESFGGRTKRSMRKSIPYSIPAFGGMLFSLHT